MKLGILFAGQGSQHPGMGQDFYEKSPAFRQVFDLLNESQKQIAFSGPAEIINDTRNTQPIMVAFAAGVLAELMPRLAEKNIEVAACAGLSLGEYSALCCSGVFDPETALRLVQIRANAMADAASGIDCGMKAILGLDEATLRGCCERAEEEYNTSSVAEHSDADGKATTGASKAAECGQPKLKLARIANLNCTGQIVISGQREAVDLAAEYALEAGAKRAVALAVSGPFHTDYMKPAGEVLEPILNASQLGDVKIPVIFNAVGRQMAEGESVAELLVKQVSSPVHFEESIREMEKMGIDTVIEIGPGKALSGFVRKTCRGIKCVNIESFDDMESALAGL